MSSCPTLGMEPTKKKKFKKVVSWKLTTKILTQVCHFLAVGSWESHISFQALCLHLFDGDNIGPDIRCKEIRHIMCITLCLVSSRSINTGDPERLCGLSKVTQGRHTRFLGWADF